MPVLLCTNMSFGARVNWLRVFLGKDFGKLIWFNGFHSKVLSTVNTCGYTILLYINPQGLIFFMIKKEVFFLFTLGIRDFY